MTTTTYAEARQNMVDNQLRANKVVDEALLAVMGRLPRELFVPLHLRGIAYVDEDLPLGNARYLIEPMVLARLIQAAELKPGDKVLDIGAATGYSTAVLGSLAASVVALESDPRLAERARANLSELAIANATVTTGPLEAGHAALGPYDVVLIGGAVERLPRAVVDQLSHGGRLVTVMRRRDRVGEAVLHRRSPAAEIALFDAATPVMPGFVAEPSFVF
ncbi:MAG: protein-L-isoaspartate O-methyltransferase [Alphaproteobacteria bacterium]|nr:protein-L-isoaspartate O-methyltransferase [Alphaproteobacteria bacterium]